FNEPPLLDRTDALLSDLFDGLDEAVLVAGRDGRLIDANAAACALLGYSREELLHLRRGDVAVGEQAWRETEYGRFVERGLWRGPVQVRRKDGAVLDVEVRAQQLELAAGAVQVVLLRPPRAGRRSTETETDAQRFASILESTNEGIYGVDLEGRCTFINPAGAHLLGYRPDEVHGQDMHALVHHSHRDGTPFPADECPVNRSALRGLRGRLDGEVLWRKDGTPIDVEYSVSPLIEGGVVQGAVVAFIDISARRRIETELRQERERLRRLVDANIIGIMRVDLGGEILEANDAFLAITGYARADLAAGRLRWDALTPPEFAPLDERAVAEAQQRGVCTPYEKQFRRRDGERVSVLVGFALLESNGGEAIAFVVDQSERQRVEQALEHLLERESAVRREAEENERRYQTLAEAMPQMVWSATADGNADYFNQRWYA